MIKNKAKAKELKLFQFQTDNAIRAARGIKKISWEEYCNALSIVPVTTQHRIAGSYNPNDYDGDTDTAELYRMIRENAVKYGYYNR